MPAFTLGRPRLKPNASTLRARFVLAIEPFLLTGWVAVYLDGSSELVHGVRIGGFGVCSDSGLSFSSPLPVHDPKMNIRVCVYSELVGYQTSDIGLLWTSITQTMNPSPPSPLVDALQCHDGRRVQAKDEAAAHAMERVLFVPERDGLARGVRASITMQKPKTGPDRGMLLWVQGRPEMVALFATVLSGCAATNAS